MPVSTRATDSAQHECEHCSFSFVPPESATTDVVRCPRCWRPVSVSQSDDPPPVFFKPVDSDTDAEMEALTSDTSIHSHDALDELIDTLESEKPAQPQDVDVSREEQIVVTDEELAQLSAEDLEALGFGHLVTVVEDESPAGRADVLPQPEPRPETPSRPEKKPSQDEPDESSHSDGIKRSLASYMVSFLIHSFLMILAALFVYRTQDFRWHGEIEGVSESIEDGGGLELQAPIEFEAPLPSPDVHLTDEAFAGSVGQGFGESPGKGGIGFFGTKARGKSFAFVVDISGSMTQPLTPSFNRGRRNRRERDEQQPVTRWQKAREELMNAIDAMSENQSFSVMLYNDVHHAFQRDGEPAGLMRATQRNKEDVRLWLNTVNARGGTEPQLSMHEALKLEPEVLFFLTDGIIPADTRETARQSNIGETVIHTTCIGSLENTILQLIANDHGGRFRSVGADGFETGADGITLFCFASSETTHRQKFKHLEDDLKRFKSRLEDGKISLHDDDSHSMLILHNATSDIPEFALEIQRLLKELNAGTRAGFDVQIGSGRLGIDVPLDNLGLRFSNIAVEQAAKQKMTVRELLETAVSEDYMDAPQAVNAIYVFGDISAKREVLGALEVFNLYNGSVIRIADGDEAVKNRR